MHPQNSYDFYGLSTGENPREGDFEAYLGNQMITSF
jgi:hypothetical protein